MKAALEKSGRFTVDVATSPGKGEDMSGFAPKFSDYDVVLSNYNGDRWSKETEHAFLDYLKNGGGFVCIHAADNSFGDWPEYNEIIGLGGWGGRNEASGPYVYINVGGAVVRDMTKGNGGNHGPQHEFEIVIRDSNHPITRGMPRVWLHAKDELYDRLRGPASHMRILATAYAPKDKGGRDMHEPMMMVLDYGQGRIFHTPMGHADYSMQCTGFITTLLRGTEWAATGKVTIPIPADFPTRAESRSRNIGGKESKK
jgi:type 1 glutamine amidotransferase